MIGENSTRVVLFPNVFLCVLDSISYESFHEKVSHQAFCSSRILQKRNITWRGNILKAVIDQSLNTGPSESQLITSTSVNRRHDRCSGEKESTRRNEKDLKIIRNCKKKSL